VAVGYDSVTAAHLPPGGDVYFGYVDGIYANLAEVRARFPDKPVFSIAVSAATDADFLDVERYDATPEQAPGWVHRQLARGAQRPGLYASQSVMPAVLHNVTAAGVARKQVRLWSAHYTQQHLCGPLACEAQFDADATQWAGSPGASPGPYDVSLIGPTFLPTVQVDRQTTAAKILESDEMVYLFHSPDGKAALAAVPGCGLVGVSSAAQAKAMYGDYRESRPTAAEWADIVANYKSQKVVK